MKDEAVHGLVPIDVPSTVARQLPNVKMQHRGILIEHAGGPRTDGARCLIALKRWAHVQLSSERHGSSSGGSGWQQRLKRPRHEALSGSGREEPLP